MTVLRWTLTLIALLASSAASAVASEAEVAQTTSQAKAAPSAGNSQASVEREVISWRLAERWVDALTTLGAHLRRPTQQQAYAARPAPETSQRWWVERPSRPARALLRATLQPRAPPSC